MSFIDSIASALSQTANNSIGAASSFYTGAQKAFGINPSSSGGNVTTGAVAYNDGTFKTPTNRPAYSVQIEQHLTDGTSRKVTGYLPEEFGWATSASWSAPFAEGLVSSDKLNMAAQLLGTKFTLQGMSANFWTGNSPIEFSLPLVFTAESAPSDILSPIKVLNLMSQPTTDGAGFFTAPGPTLKAANQIKQNVVQSVGQLLNLTNASNGTQGSDNTPNPASPTAADKGSTTLDTIISKIKTAGAALVKQLDYDNTISLTIGGFMFIPDLVITGVDHGFKSVMSVDYTPMQVTLTVSFRTHKTPSANDINSWFLTDTQPDIS